MACCRCSRFRILRDDCLYPRPELSVAGRLDQRLPYLSQILGAEGPTSGDTAQYNLLRLPGTAKLGE